MKKATLKLTLALVAILLTGCASSLQSTPDQRRAEISWNAFCAARGCNPTQSTPQATEDYLDGWCGSTEEEAAFLKAGINPY